MRLVSVNSTLMALAIAGMLLVPAGVAIAPTYCFHVDVSFFLRVIFDFISDPDPLSHLNPDYFIDYAYDLLECPA